ncbi:GNAT family N-acetyltransferase [Bacillus salipaludis]|uniref:GNAT family N-acetyltransferase n=1 Tax=Bacillus salipaludis TaxID=2547811 RepID=A0A4R5VKR5_9BACI|nr:GNAT family N-acetyltransferase [Bacillus salipaludis]MDQ6597736.1 GNAT family N-acetyltransferase [Bacillus salipaludis]TDK56341.1 GNAT family N-acetyltransferase [Bacillus salipaludis]
MLIKYKKSYEKIAMGLLSFIPSEKDLKKMMITINEYDTEKDRTLYLWKEKEGIVGLIGILFKNNQILLQHIAINPSHRNQGFGKHLVKALKRHYPTTPILPTENTEAFLHKCNIIEDLQKDMKELMAAPN